MSELKAALQLYTVRDEAAADFPGTLKKVAAIGYKAVQVSGLHGMEAQALRDVLDECGLAVAGTHQSIEAFTDDLDTVIATNKTLGSTDLICPYLPAAKEADPAVWDKAVAQFNEIGQKVADAGLRFGYHNHDFEFAPVGGTYFLEYLLEKTDPKLMTMELDVGWAWYAGVDPTVLIKKYGSRMPLIHAKDHDKDDKKINRPVGEGALDWDAIFAAARAAGTEWAIVEEDKTVLPPLQSVAVSLRNLQAMGIA